MSDIPNQTSNELVGWLRLLSLPALARWALILVMACVFAGGAALVVGGFGKADSGMLSSGVGLLTVALPVMLVVLALVFGQGGEKRLRELTTRVLDVDVPEAIKANLGDPQDKTSQQPVEVKRKVRGCIADYEITSCPGGHDNTHLSLRLELNVRKVNVLVWLPPWLGTQAQWPAQADAVYRSTLIGAKLEGYHRNDAPVFELRDGHYRHGFVLIKTLEPEFLLKPAERLYFAQDFAFLVRGLLDAGVPRG